MNVSEIRQNSQSLLPQVKLNSHKLGLDLKKSQTLGLLPSSPDFILSPSLMNQIVESKLLTTDIVRNYQSRVEEIKEDFGIDVEEEQNVNQEGEFETLDSSNSIDVYL